MDRLSCFILDDEPLAIKVIETYLQRFPQFELRGIETDPVKAFQLLQANPVDLLFLDIEMPEINGLEFLEGIQPDTTVILTTAYREYAVEGFEKNVLDYLVKPIPFPRFSKSIARYLTEITKGKNPENSLEQAHIFVRADRKQVKIPLVDIYYVEGLKDYVRIVLDQKKWLIKGSLGHFGKQLPSDQFIRCHKSYIVAKHKITAYTNTEIELGEKVLPIGRTYKEDFLKNMSL